MGAERFHCSGVQPSALAMETDGWLIDTIVQLVCMVNSEQCCKVCVCERERGSIQKLSWYGVLRAHFMFE